MKKEAFVALPETSDIRTFVTNSETEIDEEAPEPLRRPPEDNDVLGILRSGQRWILWIVIVGVGGVFAFTFGLGGGSVQQSQAGDVVIVDKQRFTLRDLARIRDRQEAKYRERFGDTVDTLVEGGQLDEFAAETLVRFGILTREAQELGLVVTDREVRDYLKNISGAVSEEGTLNRDAVTQFAEREYGSVRRFQEQIRGELLSRKFSRLVSKTVAVSAEEVLASLRHQQESAEIAWIGFDSIKLPPSAEVTSDQIKELLANEETKLRLAYEDRRGQYDRPEEIRARHILIQTPSDESERVKARDKLLAARVRIEGGESFEDLAREMSEDPGTRENGGDLGVFRRGMMVPEFEKAAFGLEEGALSEPIETSFGLHLIRVEEKFEARVVKYEVVKEDLARELLEEEVALEYAEKESEGLLSAILEGQSLTEAARSRGHTLNRPPAIRRDDSIEGLGISPDINQAVFEEPGLGSVTEIFEISGQRVLVEVLRRDVPSNEQLSSEVPETQKQLFLERQIDYEEDWIRQRRQELERAGKITVNRQFFDDR